MLVLGLEFLILFVLVRLIGGRVLWFYAAVAVVLFLLVVGSVLWLFLLLLSLLLFQRVVRATDNYHTGFLRHVQLE